jgi:hypothetical protein
MWYLKNYDIELNKKKIEESTKAREDSKKSRHVAAKIKQKAKDRVID